MLTPFGYLCSQLGLGGGRFLDSRTIYPGDLYAGSIALPACNGSEPNVLACKNARVPADCGHECVLPMLPAVCLLTEVPFALFVCLSSSFGHREQIGHGSGVRALAANGCAQQSALLLR